MHRNFVVTSNYSIRGLYKDAGEEIITAIERRFKVIHMKDPFNVYKPEENEFSSSNTDQNRIGVL